MMKNGFSVSCSWCFLSVPQNSFCFGFDFYFIWNEFNACLDMSNHHHNQTEFPYHQNSLHFFLGSHLPLPLSPTDLFSIAAVSFHRMLYECSL